MSGLDLVRGFLGARLEAALASPRPEAADVLIQAVRHRFLVGIAVFAAASLLTLNDAVLGEGNVWALIAVLAIPAAILLRGRPRVAALALVAGGIILRVAVAGVWDADQVSVTVAAGRAALDGYNPYGHGYGAAVPPGAPFPYGPLALLVGLPGQIVESAASVGTMLLFIVTGSWVTLGLYAADSFSVHSATQGVNDLTPGLLIAVGFLALRKQPILGGLVLAVAAAIKPYAFAWFPAAVGYAGLPALIGLTGGSIVLWSPLLEWGVGNFVKSVAMARGVHATPNALNIPELRVLGIPIAIAGLWVRKWEVAVLLGTIVFTVVLFFDHWASRGYWLAVMPIMGIAIEEWVVRRAPTIVRVLRGVPLREALALQAAGLTSLTPLESGGPAELRPGRSTGGPLGAGLGGALAPGSFAAQTLVAEDGEGPTGPAVGEAGDWPER